MFDPVTLDQLRALVTVAEQGSFSAAARKLKRVQSAISTAMINLENQLGFKIWDRSSKLPVLTEQGRAVVRSAQRVLAEVDSLRSLSSNLSSGLEASVSLCVEATLPVHILISICTAFSKEFPCVELRVDTGVMSAVAENVLNGSATIGVAGPHGMGSELEFKPLVAVHLVPVVGARHAFAAVKGKISAAQLEEAVQIVLTERSHSKTIDHAVLSPRTYRVADLHTKLELLKAHLGWGNLPEHLVREDLRRGSLVQIRTEVGEEQRTVPLFTVLRKGFPLGPAHRFMIDQLQQLCAEFGRQKPPIRRSTHQKNR